MDIRAVAKRLGLSVATISRALNPATAHLVAAPTRKKIQSFAKKYGYVPNRTARDLSTGKTSTIGVVLPNVLQSIFFNDHLIKILAGIYRVLDEHRRYNCKVIILPRGLSELNSQVLASGVDGLLLSTYCDPALSGPRFPRHLLPTWNRPTVLLNRSPSDVKRFSTVYIDQAAAARRGVEFLLEKGHRRIGMIRGDEIFQEARDRFSGYEKALAAAGLAVDPGIVVASNFQMEGGREAALTILRDPVRRPTALFCANDEMAIGALRAIRELGLRCPEDVAVVGFDGIEIGLFVNPRLTSVVQPSHAIAETGTKLLIDLIEGRVKGPRQVLIPITISSGESA